MKNKPMDSMILSRFKDVTQSAKIPRNIRFLQGEGEDTVVMTLSPKAMGVAPEKNLNMQDDEAAFEAWALLIHVHCGLRVELTWKQEPAAAAYCGPYGRFLYRAMKFAGQYSGWFSLSPALKERVEAFRTYLRTHDFCNNVPTAEAGTNDQLEKRIETLFVGECAPVLKVIGEQAGLSLENSVIYQQLPVGLFEGKKSKETSVFTGQKSAIDLWTTSGDSIVIFELKAENAMVGILTELIFYANYMADMFINKNTFTPLKPKVSHRGYSQLFPLRFRRVKAALLINKLHPLITPAVLYKMNHGATNILYYDLRYAWDVSVRPLDGPGGAPTTLLPH